MAGPDRFPVGSPVTRAIRTKYRTSIRAFDSRCDRRWLTRPTGEDREWFPELAGSDWRQALDFAMRNFKDESFIAQYLSPKLMRDFRLFALADDDGRAALRIDAIHDDQGYRTLRRLLSDQYNLGSREPNIQVWNVDLKEDRSLTLRHFLYQRRPLGDNRD